MYKGKTKPYSQQKEAFNKTKLFAYAAYFMEQGTGKTKVVIDRSVYLWEAGKIDGVMVLCPNALTDTWVEEIATHCPDRANPVVAVWDSSLTKKVTKALEAVLYSSAKTELPFLIMNIEAVRTEKGKKLAHWWAKRNDIHLVCDESQIIATPSASQTVCAIGLARNAKGRSIMTGTPTDGKASDYFSQLNFLMPNPLGFSNYYSFRARYCTLENKRVHVKPYFDRKKGKQVNTRKIIQITGNQNVEELKKRLLEFSYFCKKADCMDLPPKIPHKRTGSLSKEGLRIYKSVCTQIITEIEDDRYITAEIALSKLIRLQQITGGFLPSDDDPNAEPIPGSNPKIDMLIDTTLQFPGPTLYWARFKAEHKAIIRALQSITKASNIGEITGRVDKKLREDYRRAFQKGEIEYLVMSQSCGGAGYTLTAAENEQFYSNLFSHRKRVQAEDRAHRIGLHHPVNIIDLLVPVPAKIDVDVKIYEALVKKGINADMLTDVRSLK